MRYDDDEVLTDIGVIDIFILQTDDTLDDDVSDDNDTTNAYEGVDEDELDEIEVIELTECEVTDELENVDFDDEGDEPDIQLNELEVVDDETDDAIDDVRLLIIDDDEEALLTSLVNDEIDISELLIYVMLLTEVIDLALLLEEIAVILVTECACIDLQAAEHLLLYHNKYENISRKDVSNQASILIANASSWFSDSLLNIELNRNISIQ